MVEIKLNDSWLFCFFDMLVQTNFINLPILPVLPEPILFLL